MGVTHALGIAILIYTLAELSQRPVPVLLGFLVFLQLAARSHYGSHNFFVAVSGYMIGVVIISGISLAFRFWFSE